MRESDGQAEVERFYQAVIVAYRSIRETGGAADALSVSPVQWARLKADIGSHIVYRAIGEAPLPVIFAGLVLDVDLQQTADFILV